MNDVFSGWLLVLGRATLFVSLAALLATVLLRVVRARSPWVHRAAWCLVLVTGWFFVRLPVAVPWYEGQLGGTRSVASADQTPAASQTEPRPSASGLLPPQESSQYSSQPGEDLVEIGPRAADASSDSAPPAPIASLPSEAPQWDDELKSSPPRNKSELGSVYKESPLQESLSSEVSIPPKTLAQWAASTSNTVVVATPPNGASTSARGGLSSFFPTVVAGLWLAGMAAAVLRWLAGYVRSIRAMSTAIGPDEDASHQWRALLAEHGITRDIPLRLTTRMGPLLCRWPDGYELVVPAEFWRSLAPAARESIMRHELAHYQRGDVWKSLAVRVLALPHWFNPAAWWAVRRFDEAAEWACDEAAVVRGQKHTEFARTLVTLAEASLGGGSCHPAIGRWNLSARIGRLLDSSRAKDSIMKKLVLGTLALLLVAVFLVRVDLVAKSPPVEPQAQSDPQAQSEPRPSGSGTAAPSQRQPSEPGMSGIGAALALAPSDPPGNTQASTGGTRSVASEGHDAAPSTAPSRADLRAALDAQQLGLYLSQLSQLEIDLRTLRADLTVARAALQRLDKAPVNTFELERLKLDDPTCREFQKKIADLQAVRNQSAAKSQEQSDQFSQQILEQMKVLHSYLNARLATLTETVTEAKRSELRERIEELAIKVEMAAESRAELERTIRSLRKELDVAARPAAATSGVSGVAASDPRSRLRYEGRSFDQWKTSLETELSRGKQTEAVQALATFGQKGYGPEAAQAIIRLTRDYAWFNGLAAMESHPVHAAYRAFYEMIPPADGMPVLRRELKDGNDNSRGFVIYVLGRLSSRAADAAPTLAEFIRNQKPGELRTAALMTLFRADDAAETVAVVAGEALDRGPDPEEAEACVRALGSRQIKLLCNRRWAATRVGRALKLLPRDKTLLNLLTDYADSEKSPVRRQATLVLLRQLVDLLRTTREVQPENMKDVWPSLRSEVRQTLGVALRRAVLAYARLDAADRHDAHFARECVNQIVNEPTFLLWASDAAESDDKELAQAVVLLLKEYRPDPSSLRGLTLSPAVGAPSVPQQPWWQANGQDDVSSSFGRRQQGRSSSKPRAEVSVGRIRQAPDSDLVGHKAIFVIHVANRTGLALTNVRIQCDLNEVVCPTDATRGFKIEGDSLIWTFDSWPAGQTRKLQIRCENVSAAKLASCRAKLTSAEGVEGEGTGRYEIRLPDPPEPKMVPIDEPSPEPVQQAPTETEERHRKLE